MVLGDSSVGWTYVSMVRLVVLAVRSRSPGTAAPTRQGLLARSVLGGSNLCLRSVPVAARERIYKKAGVEGE